MNLRQVKYLLYALAASCVPIVVLLVVTKSLVFLWLLLALAAAVVAVNIRLWRCPCCGGHLDRGVPQYCPHCGEYLGDLQ